MHHHALIKSASYMSVIINILIIGLKMYAWLSSDSHAILASLVDSMLDISSSAINLIAILFVLQPPDDQHRFGHEKIQDLAIFSQSIFFIASALSIFVSSIRSLAVHEVVTNGVVAIDIMYICTAFTFFLVCYQTYVIKKTKSELIAVDKIHYFSDFIANIGVIISIYLSSQYWFIDQLFAIGVSIYILYLAYHLLKKSIRNLIDQEMPEEEKKAILEIISRFPDITGVHELKTRYAGSKAFIQFHVEMDGDISLSAAHKVSDDITNALLDKFTDSEIIIHQDPQGVEHNVNYRENFIPSSEVIPSSKIKPIKN